MDIPFKVESCGSNPYNINTVNVFMDVRITGTKHSNSMTLFCKTFRKFFYTIFCTSTYIRCIICIYNHYPQWISLLTFAEKFI